MADSGQPATATGRDAVLSDLMRRITLRDQSALTALYDATSSQVYGLALSILRCEADAEEVTLDVFERLWRTASIRFDPAKGSVLALILVMTRNLSIDRRRAKLARSAETELPEFWTELFAADFPDPEQITSLEQMRQRVRAALDCLTPEQRQSIELAFLEGFTHQEIAVQLGQPIGTVKSRIRLALSRLRDTLRGAD